MNIGHWFISIEAVGTFLVSHFLSLNLLLFFSLCMLFVNFHLIFSLTHLMKLSCRSYITVMFQFSFFFPFSEPLWPEVRLVEDLAQSLIINYIRLELHMDLGLIYQSIY